MRARARAFLLAQRDRHGLWRQWTSDHPYFRQLPPDMDDTCCVSAALAGAGSKEVADPARAARQPRCQRHVPDLDHAPRTLDWRGACAGDLAATSPSGDIVVLLQRPRLRRAMSMRASTPIAFTISATSPAMSGWSPGWSISSVAMARPMPTNGTRTRSCSLVFLRSRARKSFSGGAGPAPRQARCRAPASALEIALAIAARRYCRRVAAGKPDGGAGRLPVGGWKLATRAGLFRRTGSDAVTARSRAGASGYAALGVGGDDHRLLCRGARAVAGLTRHLIHVGYPQDGIDSSSQHWFRGASADCLCSWRHRRVPERLCAGRRSSRRGARLSVAYHQPRSVYGAVSACRQTRYRPVAAN